METEALNSHRLPRGAASGGSLQALAPKVGSHKNKHY